MPGYSHLIRSFAAAFFCALLAACSSGSSSGADASPGDGDGDQSCTAEALRCSPDDQRQTQTCSADGEWVDGQLCASSEQCISGSCVDVCAEAAENDSYMGCEYWPTSTGNARLTNFGTDHPLVVALANPHGYEVTATITGGTLAAPLELSIGPDQVETAELDVVAELGGKNESVLASGGAYRVVTDAPVAAYQFALADGQLPDGSSGSTVNDASLLLPTSALGTEHTALAYDDAHYGDVDIVYGGLIAVVGVAEGTTSVAVTARSGITGGDGVPAIAAGSTANFQLGQGDVLQLVGDGSGDLTGTKVVSDQPVAVFTGHVGAQVPQLTYNLVDHLQEQLPPDSTWGTQFVAAALDDIPSRLRVLALRDGTTVSFDPAAVGGPRTLAAGEHYEIAVPGDVPFAISATGPVLVGQYMESPGGAGQQHDSYPSMVLATPAEQYRLAVALQTPASHPSSILQIVGPESANPAVDDQAVSVPAVPVGSSGQAVWNVPVGPGRHTVTASAPVGVIAFGLEGITTYAYPGGLDLATLID